jgi:indole-3-glycerol phosphate synthase
VQAFPAWTPPSGTLGRIVAEAYGRADALRASETDLDRRAAAAPPAPSLRAALRRPSVAVIAEVKRRSPSKGWINPELSAAEQAVAYEQGGAAAVSILTEPAHFGGSAEDLVAVRERVSIPVLKKDFHVDPIQLLEAKAIGASAALLIARALAPDALVGMLTAARELALEVIVEIRDDDELRRALDAGADIVGINNRNLETLVIDHNRSAELLRCIPPKVIGIAESGVSARADVERVAAVGADAVLVGSVLSAASDPVAAVRAIAGVPRVDRR